MFSLFVKLLIPTASAISINFAPHVVVPLPAFAGIYTQIAGNCGAETVSIKIDSASNLIMSSAGGQDLLVLPSIDQGRQSIINGTSESVNDTYGTIKSVINDRTAFTTTTTTATLKDGTLSIRRHVLQGFSRGGSAPDLTCVLKK